uniref:M35 family metallo-endopeptidase n=1 Tax=Herbidospora sakaeratensis TaxID=564415 RepID=UPI0007809287|nr:M35 family metallo-endopeptidase [Herbidospora sakaeratensis]
MQNTQLFECALRTQPRYRLGDQILVSFEIRNTSEEPYRILTWDIPLLDSPLNFLSVSHEGSELLYDGPMVRRVDPTEKEYISLAPGESRSAEVDISRLYAIQLPGEYTVTLNTELADVYSLSGRSSLAPRVRRNHERYALEHVSATLTVEAGDPPRMTLGQAARLESMTRLPGGPGQEPSAREPFMPWLIGGTPAQQADVRSAHAQAVFKVGKALDVINSGPGNWHYRRWFGVNAKYNLPFGGLTTYTVAAMGINSIRSIMNFPTFPVQTYVLSGGRDCDESTLGYTYAGSHTVWLCGPFWGVPLSGIPDGKSGTLIHEWSHAVASTSDFFSGPEKCLQAAAANPAVAVVNACNYEYFCEFL